MKDHDINKYKTIYTYDKDRHPDSEKIRFLNKDVTLGEIRSAFSAFDERRYKSIVFYDDIFQYTSLGLFDIVCEIYGFDELPPINDFFNRKEIYGVEFIFNYLNKKYPGRISLEDILKIEKENYGEIIQRSPLSKNFRPLFKIRELMDAQLIVFKYKFNGVVGFLKSISKDFDEGYCSIEPVYLNGSTEKNFYKTLPKNKLNYFDIVICNDAKSLLDYTIEKDIEETYILTSMNHCGITEEDRVLYEVLLEGVGPNYSNINYLAEDI